MRAKAMVRSKQEQGFYRVILAYYTFSSVKSSHLLCGEIIAHWFSLYVHLVKRRCSHDASTSDVAVM
jgi:hypothetical protein